MSILLRLGTRGSPLALAQARETQALLARAHDIAPERIEIRVIKTSGDIIRDRPLSEVGGKGLFTREIERALADGEIDIGVHSAKDMSTLLPDGLVLSAFLEREDVRDALISPKAASIAALPLGAVIGTAALRRQAQVKHLRPDLNTILFRGNVETRLRKIAEGEADATLLAVAGLKRLGLLDHATAILSEEDFLPAIGQGAIGLETRADDGETGRLVAGIDHRETHLALTLERAFLRVLDGSCRTPIAGHAKVAGERISFRGQILKPDGSAMHEATRSGGLAEAEALGRSAGEELRSAGGPDFFAG
ncbi:porphobilinogen deaminase [Labrys miyagiensis]|uniref:Porphobilinogen deaminase n=1 Tax=Labrys miyagiensis TaxID=346912 RepID=A0ABQ6CRL8_9HYPH|nr:porphobilinogen deaminase [Labrys miyagiensis]